MANVGKYTVSPMDPMGYARKFQLYGAAFIGR